MKINTTQGQIKDQLKTFYSLLEEITSGPFYFCQESIKEVETKMAAKNKSEFEGDMFSNFDQMNKGVQDIFNKCKKNHARIKKQ